MNRIAMITILTITILLTLIHTSCGTTEQTDKLNIVTTTTMLNDLVEIIGEGVVETEGLCGYGIDPHSYNATAGDIIKMTNADVVIYNGLNLEGKMGEVFSTLESQNKNIIVLENAIDEKLLLQDEESNSEYDPHIWFDVNLWKECAIYVSNELSKIDIKNADTYVKNLSKYMLELEELDDYINSKVEELPENKRVLITAHDAFNYFGTRYGFKVIGLQGINTQTEVSTKDISDLASFIVENKINTIFVETSVSSKNIQALQEAVKAQGFAVDIGAALYSDSLGDKTTGQDTYVNMVKYNIDSIVEGLLWVWKHW